MYLRIAVVFVMASLSLNIISVGTLMSSDQRMHCSLFCTREKKVKYQQRGLDFLDVPVEISTHRLGDKKLARGIVLQAKFEGRGGLAVNKVEAHGRQVEENNDGIEENSLGGQLGVVAKDPRNIHGAVRMAHPDGALVTVVVEH